MFEVILWSIGLGGLMGCGAVLLLKDTTEPSRNLAVSTGIYGVGLIGSMSGAFFIGLAHSGNIPRMIIVSIVYYTIGFLIGIIVGMAIQYSIQQSSYRRI